MGESAVFDVETLEALPAGAAIGGYSIRRMIGHGGFGITYEAHNQFTGKSAAIKEFFPSSMVRRDGQSRLIYSKVNAETIGWALRKFEETTKTLCGLEHPNIVQVHDYVPANDTGYMIMELLDGETLEHWLQAREEPPCLDELRPIVDPVMEALIYVHGRGLIHRDIAPDNILITRGGRPVLIDFGSVSRDLSDARQKAMSSTIGVAKRNYTAPEQTRAKARPTPEADIYSMGAVLYRALSGVAPVDGQERVDAIFHGNGPDPFEPLTGRVPAGCTARAAQAIDTALAIHPERRLHKVADLQAAMVAPAPPVAPVAPRTPARWLAAAALAVMLAALGGGFAGMRWATDDNLAARTTLDGQRKELDRGRADVERERGSLQAATADVARQHDALDAAKVEIDRRSTAVEAATAAVTRQHDALDAAKAEIDRRSTAVEAATAAVTKQRDALDAAKAEIDRRSAAVEAAKADVDRQRSDLAAAKAGVDREGATMRTAKDELDRQHRSGLSEIDEQRKEMLQAKADLAQQQQDLRAERFKLSEDRDQLSRDRGALDRERGQLGQSARNEVESLAKQASDSQARAEDADRKREAAEADAARLREQVQADVTEIGRQSTQLRDTSETVAALTAENERLRRSVARPAAVPAAPPSGPDWSALYRKARAATVAFYDKHNYTEGGTLDDLAALYPSDTDIVVNGEPRTGRQQIEKLEQYYRTKKYTSFNITVEAGSFDFAACRSPESCIVKGVTDASFQTAANPAARSSTSNFCLRLNLRGSPKVLAEASTRPGKDASCD